MQQKFSYKSQLLYFKDRLFIPLDFGLIPSLLTEFHASPVGGHSGVQATLSQIYASFYWSGMHKDVKQNVMSKLVHPPNTTSIPSKSLTASSNLYHYPSKFGKIFPWILSPTYPSSTLNQ